jgi:esterase/lipase superfamily enzyme
MRIRGHFGGRGVIVTAALVLTAAPQGGTAQGPVRAIHRIAARATETTVIDVGRDGTSVVVQGDGDTDIDCWLYDESGRLIASDNDATDYCVFDVTRIVRGRVRLIIRNLGSVYNDAEISVTGTSRIGIFVPGSSGLPLPRDTGGLPDAGSRSRYASLADSSVMVRVFYGTTRRWRPSLRPQDRFTAEPTDTLEIGAVLVNVPSYQRRAEGEIPKPPLWRVNRFVYRPDATRDMYVAAVTRLAPAEFFRAVNDAARGSDSGGTAFVFVHGYNVPFADAALRTAQIAADLGFPGAPLMFSWPSRGHLVGYPADQANARYSGHYLADFLRDVAERAGAARIHLIGHSMGSEVVATAAARLAATGTRVQLDQIVLAAPDIDWRLFRRDVLPVLNRHSRRITVYASSVDEALKASRGVNGVWRLGLGGDSLVVLPGMDTVDATSVRTDLLGHSPFPSTPFLSDLAAVLTTGAAPDEQPRRLLRVPRSGLAFWRFRPPNQ